MSYPYLSDLFNTIFGTSLNVPIATFGSVVVIAIGISTLVAKREVVRYESLDLIPKAYMGSGKFVPVNQLITDLIMTSVIFALFGARIFHILEYPDQFLNEPIDMIFSRGGFSIYGGLAFGLISGALYLRKHLVPIIPVLDALSPSLLLGYAIGRIGCQLSGDGDWGVMADLTLKPAWVPDWFWAQTYENNVLGITIPSPGVYPTPLYESIMAFCAFLFLWQLKKLGYKKGSVFFVYLLLSGYSRLWIEKIRINSEYHFLELSFTQAELISFGFIVIGSIWILRNVENLHNLLLSSIFISALFACTIF